MKLLTKSEIDKKRADEFRREREEGLKLARNVDRLRQIRPQEEATLAKWRSDTLAQIHAEIKTETEKRDVLIADIRRLTGERGEALKPLTEEMALLEKKREEISQANKTLETKEEEIRQLEKTTKASNEVASLELKKAVDERRRATEFLQEADFNARESRLALAESESIRDSVRTMQENVEAELRERDANLAMKESSLKLRSDAVKEDEQKLAKEWILLNDRKKMLTRIKK